MLRRINKKGEQGSALVMAMFVTTALLSLVGLSTLSEDTTRSIVEKNKRQLDRNEVAKTIVSFITNPEMIKLQAKTEKNDEGEITEEIYKEVSDGHEMLYNCLNGTGPCDRTPEEAVIAGGDGYLNLPQLTLLLPEGYQYPVEKTDRAPNQGQSKNCPNPPTNPGNTNDPSCLLAGTAGGQKVGFNLRGETSNLSPCFPFEPVVYVNPYCGPDDLSSCDFAEDIEFYYQLIHRTNLGECPLDRGKKQSSLGTFPKKPEIISLPRHALVEYQCNPGAFITGYESDGSLTCECRFPWTPQPGRSNQNGVLCERLNERCPRNDSVFMGRNGDGSPICVSTSDPVSVELPPNQANVVAAIANTVDDPVSFTPNISCPNKGWLHEIDMECDGGADTVEEPGEGFSCLFFYQFIKLIDDGKVHIPGELPAVIYREDETLPCNAVNEEYYFGGGVIGAPTYDQICYGVISGLLFLGGVNKATERVAVNAALAALVAALPGAVAIGFFGNMNRELTNWSIALTAAMAASAAVVNGLKAIPFVGFLVAAGAAAGFGALYIRWKARVNYNCYDIETENKRMECRFRGKCKYYDGDYTQ